MGAVIHRALATLPHSQNRPKTQRLDTGKLPLCEILLTPKYMLVYLCVNMDVYRHVCTCAHI